MNNRSKKILQMFLALALILPLSLGSITPVKAEYVPSVSEIMYLRGLEAAYSSQDKSYTIYDINNDDTKELFIGTKLRNGDTLEVFVYNGNTNEPELKKTIKKAVRVYQDPEHSMIIVETKAAPANTFTSYKLTKDGTLKAKLTIRAEKGGKYYKNKKEISASKYKAYKKKLEQNYTEMHFSAAAEPWVDSSIPGVADIVGDPGPKNDFRLSTAYSWLSEEHLADGEKSNSWLTPSEEEINKNTQALLTDREHYTGDNINIVRSLYDLATDWETRDKGKADPLRKYVDIIAKKSSLFELSELITSDEMFPTGGPVYLALSVDSTDMSHWIAIASPKIFSISPSDYVEASASGGDLSIYREGFDNLVRYALTRAGYTNRMIDKTLSLCYEFENSLMSETNWDEINENYYTYTSFAALCKNFPLEGYMINQGLTGGKIKVQYPSFFKVLDKVWTEENLEALKAYFIAHTACQSLPYLDYEAAAIAGGYLTFDGKSIEETAYTKEEILDALNEQAKEGVLRGGLTRTAWQNAYMEYFTDLEAKADLLQLCEEIRDAMEERLKNAEWLSEATIEAALEKLSAMSFCVLSPDELIDVSFLSIDPAGYFLDNQVNIQYKYYRYCLSMVGNPIDHGRWYYDFYPQYSADTIDCFYIEIFNCLIIDSGILNDNSYRPDMSDEEKLSRIGFFIAHEFSHGFDSNGWYFGKDGSFIFTEETPYGLLIEEEHNTLQAKVKKVADYIDGIWILPERNCPGETLANETIADMEGIALTLDIAEKKEGFDFDKYFRSYSDMMKDQETYNSQFYRLNEDPHLLTPLRVNVILQQFEKFYETYGIQEGDGMYLAPEERLLIW